MWLRWLEDLGEQDVHAAGRKAVTLAVLRRAGLPVLPGVVVTTAAFEQWRGSAALRELAERAERIDPREIAEFQALADLVGVRSHDAPHPATTVASEILAAADRLIQQTTADRLVVRSSATAEDMPNASFAGLYRSQLNVGRDDLLDAIRHVWASFWTPQAIAFRRKANLREHDASMAVLLQPFVPTDISGVVFTCFPLSGERDRLVVTGSWGLGEACVAGWTEPDTLVISRADQTVKERHEGSKLVMAVPTTGGSGIQRLATPEDLRQRWSLSEEQWRPLVSTAVQVEELLGQPQDIEWGWDGNHLHIFQSRPVTPLFVSLDDWELNRSPAQKQLDRSAAAFCKSARRQHAPEDRDRLLITLKQDWDDELVPSFKNAFLKLDSALATAQRAAEGSDPRGAAAQLQVALETAVATYKNHFCRLVEAGDLVSASLEKLGFTTTTRVLPQDQLALLRDRENIHLFWRTAVDELVESANVDHSVKDVVSHQYDSVHGLLGALDATRAGRRWRQAFDDVVDTHGRVSFPGYDVANPTLAEQPELILNIVRTKLINSTPGNRLARSPGLETGRDESHAADSSQIDSNRLESARQWLEVAQRNFAIRQASDYYYYITQNYVRRAFLLVGRWFKQQRLINHEDDVFFLGLERTVEILTRLATGSGIDGADLLKTIRHHRRDLIARQHSPDAHAIAALQHLCLREAEGSRTIQGVPCSPGIASGPARIIHEAADLRKLEAGDILVAMQITPSWTPFFLVAGGIVTETGGVLSHGAIIARECGVPTVVGTRLATRLIREGERVTVDGTRGVVLLSASD